MTAATELLARLRGQGLILAAAGDRVRVTPASWLTPELRTQIRRHKTELLAVLDVPAPSTAAGAAPARPEAPAAVSSWDLSAEWWDFWAERVAICHYDGGLSWPEAEALALADVLRLSAVDATGAGRPEAATSPASFCGCP